MLWQHTKTTNNSCAQYILSLSARNFFDLPLPLFLPAQAQHRLLIDTGIDFTLQAQGLKNFALYSLILTFQPRQFVRKVPRIIARRKAKIHHSYLYQINYLAVN